ncbi:hypothetical protein [Lysobacter antibioticus]|uniref:DNA transfer protein n=1 Tax=Lysobacter antibioticus TaxID=84531 RepID=A0A0S2F7H6_LYSAN|nr:hypothetical protein [Lysobacter antibioticus]ALN79509.1 hypothetical protein LA76x_1352 [Lysobacter antibioticus]
MAAITGAALAAGATIYSAKKQGDAAKDASRAGQQSAQMGIDEQRRQFDTFQQNIQPYMGAGTNALGQMTALNGGDFSSFKQSPDYQFAFDQGLQAINRGAAARGGLRSGGNDVDLVNYGQGLATQNYGNYYNRLAGLASMGQNAAVGAGSLGQQSANAIGQLYGQQGQAAAGGAINQANAQTNALGSLAGIAGQYLGNRQSSYGSAVGPVTRQPIAMPSASVNIPKYRYGA